MESTSLSPTKSYDELLNQMRSKLLASSSKDSGKGESASKSETDKRKRTRTLEQWAKAFGYKSPRIVSMVFKGQRLPSAQMIDALSRELRLDPMERRCFELLVRRERFRRTGRDFSLIQGELETLRLETTDTIKVDPEPFSKIADWYHVVLKQLLDSPCAPRSLEEIRARLRGKVSTLDLQRGLENLERLGAIKKNQRTGRYEVLPKGIRAGGSLPSTAIKRHHAQMLARAGEALFEQNVTEREFSGVTLRFDRRKVGRAKEALRRFCEQFNAEFADDLGTDVYQLNLQFFSHTAQPGSNQDGSRK